MGIALNLLRRFAPWLISAAVIGVLIWRYGAALEDIGRLESERRGLLATNKANAEAIERLGQEIADREALHRAIQADLATIRANERHLQSRLERANERASEDFRDCLAVPLPAEHISLQLDPDAD